MKTWPRKLVFWLAIVASCFSLVVETAIAAIGLRIFFAGGFAPIGRGPIEILIICALALPPLIVLFLIIRAVRLRGVGPFLRIFARALYPLAALLFASIGVRNAIEYLNDQSMVRHDRNLLFGSITYLCSTDLPDDNGKAGPITLKLTEHRHIEKLSTFVVTWLGTAPIEAQSFVARTGSYGGSQGIRWREPSGRHMTALVSFSDVVNQHGPTSLSVDLTQDDSSAATSSTPVIRFVCRPDPNSYSD